MSVREVAAWRRVDVAVLPCRYGIGRLSAELYPSERLELLLRVYLPEGAQPPNRDAMRVGFVDGDSRTLIEVRESWDVRPRAGRRAEMQVTASWQLPWPADPLGDATVAIAIDDHKFEIALPFGLRPTAATTSHLLRSTPTALCWRGVELASEQLRDHSVTLRVQSAEPGVLDVKLYCRTPTAQDAIRLLGSPAGETPDVEISIGTRRAAQIGSWSWVDGALRCIGRFDVTTPARDRHYARLTVRVAEEQFALSVPSSLTGHVASR